MASLASQIEPAPIDITQIRPAQTDEELQADITQYRVEHRQEVEEAEESNKDSIFNRIYHGLLTGRADWQNIKYFLDAKYPTPDMTQDYGDDFLDLSEDERRERILFSQQIEAENLTGISEEQAQGDPAVTVGRFIKMFATPTSLIPIGQSYKAIAAVGGAIAASDTAFNQLIEDGELDYKAIGINAAAGAILLPSFAAIVRGAKRLFISDPLKKDAANLVEGVQNLVIKKVSNGMAGPRAIPSALKELNIDSRQFSKAMQNSESNIYVPRTKQAATDILNNETAIEAKILKPGNWIDDLIQPISDRIKQRSEALYGHLIGYEAKNKFDAHKHLYPTRDFFKSYHKLPGESKALFKQAWLDRDVKTVKQLMPEHVEIVDKLRKSLDDIYPLLKKVYPKLSKIPNYLPRYIEDIEGLFKQLGREKALPLQKALLEAERKSGIALTQIEKSEIINQKLLSRSEGKFGPIGASKQRKYKVVPEYVSKFYADPDRAFHIYVHKAVQEINKRTLFGKHISVNKKLNVVDMPKTIGSYIADIPNIRDDPTAIKELTKLLSARFVIGERPLGDGIQALKNIQYSMTLGNPIAALTQLGDIPITMYKAGVFNTLRAIVGKNYTTAVEEGLVEVAEEMASSPMRSARVLEKLLRVSGFKQIDAFGKTVNLNANMRKLVGLAKSEKGLIQLEKKYGEVFKEEFPHILDDLKNDRLTQRVKVVLFSELSDVQPISKLEMPVTYLNNPNAGRLFYMLKTFTMKQINLFRRDTLREIKQGHVVEGTKNLARYSFLLLSSGASVGVVKEWAQGRDIKPEDVPDVALENMLKVFMVSEYLVNKFKTGSGPSALLSQFTDIPLVGLLDGLSADIIKQFNDEKRTIGRDKEKPLKSVQYLPLFGRSLYNIFGGAEVANERRKDNRSKSRKLGE